MNSFTYKSTSYIQIYTNLLQYLLSTNKNYKFIIKNTYKIYKSSTDHSIKAPKLMSSLNLNKK